MNDDVVNLATRRSARSPAPDGTDHLACPKCGNSWWRSPGIVMDADTMSVGAFAFPLECVECGYNLEGHA